jgi:cyclic pyranopterin phosphate synthase
MHKLTDSFHRPIRYLRLSVTDQCDLRCHYCIPKGYTAFKEPEEWLRFDEIERLVRLFADAGISSLRITGGEPLLRKNLPELVHGLAGLPGLNDLSLSTNGLGLRRQATQLKTAGITRVNISLDSLLPERFATITGGKLYKVLDGLQAAEDAGFAPIKINMVVMRDINDDEVEPMLEFCLERGYTLRYIETMPVGHTGRLASKHYLSLQSVKQKLIQRYQMMPELPTSEQHGMGPARYLRAPNSNARVGFITPISEHFCDSCNRVRLAVDGTLYPCLGQNDAVALGQLIRNGADDQQLFDAIQHTIAEKPQRHEFNGKPEQILRFMSVTGG